MRNYKCLSVNIYISDDFHLEPIRDEDKFEIMTIRNEQIYHLRQAKLLTKEDQENYFSNIVSKLFEQDFPNQLLFSFFYKNEFIGYGGLVHINWIDKNAEVSFVMKTKLEKDFFSFYWSNYLKLIEKVAFEEMKLHKIFTYAFDLRPHLYEILIENNYKFEARFIEHCFFKNKYIDVLIHSKINHYLKFRKPTLEDAELYFDWANDESVRINSYSANKIDFETHVNWFTSKLKDENCFMYLFQNESNEFIGQIRIQKQDDFFSIISVSIDANQRGKGYSNKIIEIASNDFLSINDKNTIDAYIKEENIASAKAFEKAGFILKEITNYENVKSFHYTKNAK